MAIASLSIYGSIFNATIGQFDLERMVDNYFQFAPEVCLATAPSKDDTAERLAKLQSKHSGLKVINTTIDVVADRRFDGNLKTAAMRACNNPVRMIMDLDEVLLDTPVQHDLWDMFVAYMAGTPAADVALIPVLDLYGSRETIRNSNLGVKFRLHTARVHARGVPSFAELGDGRFDPTKSDGTETINADGTLCTMFQAADPRVLTPANAAALAEAVPMVIHEGFLDLQRKALLGKQFWKDKWDSYDGSTQDVKTDAAQFDLTGLVRHGITLL